MDLSLLLTTLATSSPQLVFAYIGAQLGAKALERLMDSRDLRMRLRHEERLQTIALQLQFHSDCHARLVGTEQLRILTAEAAKEKAALATAFAGIQHALACPHAHYTPSESKETERPLASVSAIVRSAEEKTTARGRDLPPGVG